jgi:undecaprenyl-diphosphatase
MEFVSALILAFIQGIAEWFPISSSGHLVLFGNLLDYNGGLVFEVTLHFGTLMAVFAYFSKDIIDIARDILSGKWKSPNSRLGFLVLLASIPAGIVGFLVEGYFDSVLSTLVVVGVGFGITSMMLFISSVHKGKGKDISKISPFNAIIIGCAQAVSILPGVSRSGSTISSGILSGLDEKSSMKFSFLMSIPVILGASIATLKSSSLSLEFLPASLVSFAVGLASIHFVFTRGLNNRKNFVWFGIYTLILCILTLLIALI